MINKSELISYNPYLVKTRRWIHAHPEVGFDVNNTHDFIHSELQRFGIKVITHIGKNSLIGVIENGPGEVIGLRADIDALPLYEMNRSLEYVSTNDGVMHACGHDSHTAMLLTAASYLSNNLDQWKGTVKFIFQEAEEGPNPGGAFGIIESGYVNDVDHFYALHVAPMIDSGKIAIKRNEAMASADTIKITLIGKGAHAAYPHLSIDPIIMASEVIQGVQTILSRRKNPLDLAVITIAKVIAGTTHNIIPETAYLEGTVRTFSNELRAFIKVEIDNLLKSVTSRVGGKYEFEYIYEYDPVFNTSSEVDTIKEVVTSSLGESNFMEIYAQSMGAEDFSKYIFLKQGALAWLGTRKDESTSYSLHHPLFNLDEDALINGALTLVNLVIYHQKG